VSAPNSTIAMDRYGVMGFPVAHSRSPVIHAVFARQTGQAMTYELFETRPEDLESAIRNFQRSGGAGLNITVPHKSEVVRLVDEMSDNATTAGAVNTLKIGADHIYGDNTDGIGLVRDLTQNKRWAIEGQRVLILGAGGATRGITRPLQEQRPASLTIANRGARKAVALAEHFGRFGEVRSCRFAELAGTEPFDLIINATSAGLGGSVPEFPESIISESSHCYDLSYGSASTPFLTWAKKRGITNLASGWGMLVEQAAASFRLWRGVMPDTKAVLERYSI